MSIDTQPGKGRCTSRSPINAARIGVLLCLFYTNPSIDLLAMEPKPKAQKPESKRRPLPSDLLVKVRRLMPGDATSPEESEAIRLLQRGGGEVGEVTGKPEGTFRTLTCDDTYGVRDDDLARVNAIKNLKVVHLYSTQVTDAMIPSFIGSSVERLNLNTTRIQGKGLRHLTGCQRLEDLNLARTLITDDVMSEVGQLSQLRKLSLTKTKVTDAGLKYLTGLRNLETLALYGTGVTDDSVDMLARLRTLRYVLVGETKMTEQGIARLRQSRPDLTVDDRVDID